MESPSNEIFVLEDGSIAGPDGSIVLPQEIAERIQSIDMAKKMDPVSDSDYAAMDRTMRYQAIDLRNVYRASIRLIKDQVPARNSPCPCGSGKKYKRCCL